MPSQDAGCRAGLPHLGMHPGKGEVKARGKFNKSMSQISVTARGECVFYSKVGDAWRRHTEIHLPGRAASQRGSPWEGGSSYQPVHRGLPESHCPHLPPSEGQKPLRTALLAFVKNVENHGSLELFPLRKGEDCVLFIGLNGKG